MKNHLIKIVLFLVFLYPVSTSAITATQFKEVSLYNFGELNVTTKNLQRSWTGFIITTDSTFKLKIPNGSKLKLFDSSFSWTVKWESTFTNVNFQISNDWTYANAYTRWSGGTNIFYRISIPWNEILNKTDFSAVSSYAPYPIDFRMGMEKIMGYQKDLFTIYSSWKNEVYKWNSNYTSYSKILPNKNDIRLTSSTAYLITTPTDYVYASSSSMNIMKHSVLDSPTVSSTPLVSSVSLYGDALYNKYNNSILYITSEGLPAYWVSYGGYYTRWNYCLYEKLLNDWNTGKWINRGCFEAGSIGTPTFLLSDSILKWNWWIAYYQIWGTLYSYSVIDSQYLKNISNLTLLSLLNPNWVLNYDSSWLIISQSWNDGTNYLYDIDRNITNKNIFTTYNSSLWIWNSFLNKEIVIPFKGESLYENDRISIAEKIEKASVLNNSSKNEILYSWSGVLWNNMFFQRWNDLIPSEFVKNEKNTIYKLKFWWKSILLKFDRG